MLKLLGGLFGGGRTGSKTELVDDHVWMSHRAKLRGIRKELAKQTASGTTLIALVAHFPDLLTELEGIANGYDGPASVRALLAGQLSPDAARRLPLRESDVVEVIVAERHPLASSDEKLREFAEALPCRSRVVYHVSLDDAVLRASGSDKLRGVLDRLGATEDEAITHGMVTQSIRRFQQRTEARAKDRSDAGSAAEWLERNT
jgi:hypothetical protein